MPLFGISQSKNKSNASFQVGLQLEDAKNVGGKFFMGLSSNNKNGNRSMGIGLGLELISFSSNGTSSTAYPIYIDFRKYLYIDKLPVYLSLNLGTYNYNFKLNYSLNLGNGEGITTKSNTKGQAFAGFNLGAILPIKSKQNLGFYTSVGYRYIQFNTSITTIQTIKNLNGSGFHTITRDNNSDNNTGYFNASVGILF
jgi:hypothetical protein